MITVKNLTFDYPGKRALQNVSFTIEPGTITALVGPNGAGKSTLLRCLAALDMPITGDIRVDGLDVLEFPRESHSRMGFLPDFYGLYDDLTITQCLLYQAMVQKIPGPERMKHIESLADRLEIKENLNQALGTLSRGQRQRVAIAQAIIHHPKVLLLDEPASGLDPEARAHLSQLLVSLKKEGITIIVSSHILAELEDYCTHMLILRDGRMTKHCAIGVSAAAAQRFHLALSQPDNRVLDILKTFSNLHAVIEENATTFQFIFFGDAEAQQHLLRSLVEAQIPVCAFYALHPSMGDLYMARE